LERGVRLNASDILIEFEQDLLDDGKGQGTLKSYQGDVKGFLNWLLDKRVDFSGDLTRLYINSYKQWLIDNNYKINSINKKINSLNSFNMFLMKKGYSKDQVVFPSRDKLKIANGSEREVEVFSEKEVERILFHIGNKSKLVSQRDKVAILLLLFTGLRVSELVSLKIRDVDFLALNLRILGKGGKYREVPLKPEVADELKRYIEDERRNHPKSDSQHLLLTQRAEKMDKDTVNKLLRKHGKKLNLIIKPHKFRHTFCTRLIQKGVSITIVSKLAGHASVNTTASFYINTSREDKENAVNLL
jgi:integrase/recombinase XerD